MPQALIHAPAIGEDQMYIDRNPDRTFTLRDERGAVGWVREGILGFRGYHSALDAVLAAMVAHAAAYTHLKLHGSAARHCDPGRSLTTTCEGGRTWIRVGGAPVALLLPPHAALRSGPSSFAFELLVPAYLGETESIRLARATHTSLLRAGCARRGGEDAFTDARVRVTDDAPVAMATDSRASPVGTTESGLSGR